MTSTETNRAVTSAADGKLVVRSAVAGRRVLSGIQPSGSLHLGNYFGAMQQHIEAQRDNEGFFFIADFHALTSLRDPAALAHASHDVALDYLALGLDPARVCLYRQSDVPEVTELAWILACVASVGDLERAVSYKDKVRRGLTANVGLFTYPVLMAADILIVRAEVVPVGEDQLQHIEMARRWAERANRLAAHPLFVVPRAQLNEARTVPGIDGQKMSKSYGNTIPLFGDPAQVRELFFSIKTDSRPAAEPKEPDSCRAFAILRLMATPDEAAIWSDAYRRGGLRYSAVKERLVELYEERFGAARERRAELERDPDSVEEVLSEGARKVRKIADAVLAEVRDAVGLPATPTGLVHARGST